MRLLKMFVLGLALGSSGLSWPQNSGFRVKAPVTVQRASGETTSADSSGVVVWLTPLAARPPMKAVSPVQGLRLAQKNKHFEPHMIVATAGSTVEFPNHDPFFHNVFSLYKGKRFDLGFYEAGSSRSVRFDRPGVSFIFCNIHPEMSAVVLVLDTPYYAVSNQAGEIQIPQVPPGKYRVEYWFERSSPELLGALSSEVEISGDAQLGKTVIPEVTVNVTHKNKYGKDYETRNTY